MRAGRSSTKTRSHDALAAEQRAGWLVFVSLASHSVRESASPAHSKGEKGNSLPTSYMTRVEHWHTFDVVGFLVRCASLQEQTPL